MFSRRGTGREMFSEIDGSRRDGRIPGTAGTFYVGNRTPLWPHVAPGSAFVEGGCRTSCGVVRLPTNAIRQATRQKARLD